MRARARHAGATRGRVGAALTGWPKVHQGKELNMDSLKSLLPTMREFECCVAFWMIFWQLVGINQHLKGVEKVLAEERRNNRLEQPYQQWYESLPGGSIMLCGGEPLQLLPAPRGGTNDVAVAAGREERL